MAIQLGSAYGKVSLDINGLLRAVKQGKTGIIELSESGVNLGNSMRNLGAALTLSVTLPILAVGKSAIQAASAFNETANKSKVVFGSMSEDVLNWSKTSAAAFGQSQRQALEAAATFGNLFTSMKIGQDDAAQMSMKLTELASDLSSFHDVDPSVALEKLRAGLVGEAEPLRTFGIRISEAEVQAKALSMGLVQASVDMTKVKGASLDLKVAQEELAAAQRGGGVDADAVASAQSRIANASDSARRAQERLSDAQQSAQRAQRDLNALLSDPKVEKSSLRVQHARERLADAEERVNRAMDGVATASRHAAEASNNLSKARAPEAPDALKVALAEQKVAEAQDAVTRSMGGTNVKLTEAQKLQARYAIIMEQSANAQGDFARTADSFANQLRTLNAYWGNTLVIVGNMFLPLAQKVVKILIDMLSAFQKLNPFQQKMIVLFIGMAAAVGPLLAVLGVLIAMTFKIIFFLDALSKVGITFSTLGYGFSAAIPAAATLGAALVPVLIVLLAIAAQIGLLAIAWKTNFLGMRENFATSVKVWRSLWQAFTAFLRGDTDAAFAHIGEAATAFQERMHKIFGGFSDFGKNWADFLTYLGNLLSKARNYIVTAFSNVNWSVIGKSITMGIANGLVLGAGGLLLVVKNMATSVLTQIKRSLGIASPSREAMRLGIFTAQGFALGMQSMRPEDITRALTKPIMQNSSSQSQTINNYFPTGLSVQQVRAVVDERMDALVTTMVSAMGGA